MLINLYKAAEYTKLSFSSKKTSIFFAFFKDFKKVLNPYIGAAQAGETFINFEEKS